MENITSQFKKVLKGGMACITHIQ